MSCRGLLLAVLGQTPQILTETLFGLLVQRMYRLNGVRVLTTAAGKDQIERRLLNEAEGWFHRFCLDFPQQTSGLTFALSDVLTPPTPAGPYEDIRDLQQSQQFADFVLRTVQSLTAEPDTVIYASLAGGRKTMSVYLAMAMRFFGRPQDRLYHVLVSPAEFESHPEFYYPPPEPRRLSLPGGGSISTAAARIDLVEVPYVRLRGKLGEWFGREDLSFEVMVRLAQEQLRQLESLPELVLDSARHTVHIGERSFRLSTFDFAVYGYYVDRSRRRPDGVETENYEHYFDQGGVNGFEPASRDAIYHLAGRPPPKGWDREAEWDKVQQAISRIRRKIAEVLPTAALRSYYEVSSIGPYGEKKYGVKLDRSRIRVVGEAQG